MSGAPISCTSITEPNETGPRQSSPYRDSLDFLNLPSVIAQQMDFRATMLGGPTASKQDNRQGMHSPGYRTIRDISYHGGPFPWLTNSFDLSSEDPALFPPHSGEALRTYQPPFGSYRMNAVDAPFFTIPNLYPSGPTTEHETCSNESPFSPRTPGARSEVDVTVDLDGGLGSDQFHPSEVFPELQSTHRSVCNLRDIQGFPDEPPDVTANQETTTFGYGPYNFPLPPSSLGQFPYPESVSFEVGSTATSENINHTEPSSPEVNAAEDQEIDDEDETMDDDCDNDDEYSPANLSPAKRASRPQHALLPRSSSTADLPVLANSRKTTRVTKNVARAIVPSSRTVALRPNPVSPTIRTTTSRKCQTCYRHFSTPSTLHKHILSMHLRPFTCIFARYGCTARFGSKNEWQRHIRVQHLRPEIWRCDMDKCNPQSLSSMATTASKKSTLSAHDFDRKDLFTQHVRRIHAHTVYGENGGQGMSKFERNQAEEEVQKRCHVRLRSMPPLTRCGFCNDGHVFEKWEVRMEHIGRHLESGASVLALERNLPSGNEEVEDDLLRDWMTRHGLLQPCHGGMYKVVGIKGLSHAKMSQSQPKRTSQVSMSAEGKYESETDDESTLLDPDSDENNNTNEDDEEEAIAVKEEDDDDDDDEVME